MLSVYLLIAISLVIIIKTILNTESDKKLGHGIQASIQYHLTLEHAKLKNNNDKIRILEEFNESFLNRLFKITKDIILIQKIILSEI